MISPNYRHSLEIEMKNMRVISRPVSMIDSRKSLDHERYKYISHLLKPIAPSRLFAITTQRSLNLIWAVVRNPVGWLSSFHSNRRISTSISIEMYLRAKIPSSTWAGVRSRWVWHPDVTRSSGARQDCVYTFTTNLSRNGQWRIRPSFIEF